MTRLNFIALLYLGVISGSYAQNIDCSAAVASAKKDGERARVLLMSISIAHGKYAAYLKANNYTADEAGKLLRARKLLKLCRTKSSLETTCTPEVRGELVALFKETEAIRLAKERFLYRNVPESLGKFRENLGVIACLTYNTPVFTDEVSEPVACIRDSSGDKSGQYFIHGHHTIHERRGLYGLHAIETTARVFQETVKVLKGLKEMTFIELRTPDTFEPTFRQLAVSMNDGDGKPHQFQFIISVNDQDEATRRVEEEYSYAALPAKCR